MNYKFSASNPHGPVGSKIHNSRPAPVLCDPFCDPVLHLVPARILRARWDGSRIGNERVVVTLEYHHYGYEFRKIVIIRRVGVGRREPSVDSALIARRVPTNCVFDYRLGHWFSADSL